MKSNYKRIGDYIKESKTKNTGLTASKLLGINIDKFFMPSVANVIGTDMSTYKIVKKNQFACNRMHVGRDYRLPIAMSKSDEDFMVSPAYDVFEIIDTDKLLPEYLMMWFSRKEFDRNAWFYTDADVRGGLSWKALIDMQLPIPHIDKQRAIVKEYNTVVNRINLNKQLIEKLEATAQAIYKQWFVDFEFPDANGLPYKSNGGEMIDSELGEIPKGWEVKLLSDISYVKHGYAFKGDGFTDKETLLVLVSPGNFKIKGGFNFEKNKFYTGKYPKEYILDEGDLIVNMTDLSKDGDTLGNTALVPSINFKVLLHNQRVGKFELNDVCLNYFIFYRTIQKDYKHYVLGTATGTTVRHTSPNRIGGFRFILPDKKVVILFNSYIKSIVNYIGLNYSNEYYLKELQNLILNRLSTIE